MRFTKSLVSACLLIALAIGPVHAAGVQKDASAVDVEVMHHEINILNFAFAPASLSVKPGDRITWTNSDIAPHTATALDGSWNTGLLNRGESYSLIVSENMTLNYYCDFHPMMVATLQWGQ